MIEVEFNDVNQRSASQVISTDLMMEEIARRRLEELGCEYSILDWYYANRSETRERLIHVIEEVDRDVDEIYISRQVFRDLIDEFDYLWNSTGPIWRRIMRILAHLVVFILNLTIVVVLPPSSSINEISSLKKGGTGHDCASDRKSPTDYIQEHQVGQLGEFGDRYLNFLLYH